MTFQQFKNWELLVTLLFSISYGAMEELLPKQNFRQAKLRVASLSMGILLIYLAAQDTKFQWCVTSF